jgi:hypothetical protein
MCNERDGLNGRPVPNLEQPSFAGEFGVLDSRVDSA